MTNQPDTGADVRHICGISGGKDSSALAVYLAQSRPDLDIEYFFCDTGAELPEIYEYLTRLEGVLGKPIERLNANRGFDHWFEVYRGTLPSPQMRWCTRLMKIKPIEEWVGDDKAVSYVGIRADENNRKGYVSGKGNITTVKPFVDDGVDHDGVLRILDEAGLGLPDYYEWRARSGCYFCFYQSKPEWIALHDRHPELFERAAAIEKKVLLGAGEDGNASYEHTATDGNDYTWVQGMTLHELIEKRDEILAAHADRQARVKEKAGNLPLYQVLADPDADDAACDVCTL